MGTMKRRHSIAFSPMSDRGVEKECVGELKEDEEGGRREGKERKRI